jgi:hypothetical protein
LGEVGDLVRGDGQVHDVGLEQRAEVVAVALVGELGIVAVVGQETQEGNGAEGWDARVDEQFAQGRVIAPQGGPGVQCVLSSGQPCGGFLIGDIVQVESAPDFGEVGDVNRL